MNPPHAGDPTDGPPHAPTAPNAPNASGASGASGATPVAVAIGVDLLERARLIGVYNRFGERFLRRVFTDREREQAGQRIYRLAGRFAAKEACSKVLGTGIGAVAWHEIEIVRQPSGKPTVELHGSAAVRAQALGLTAFDVSISDTHDHVLAVVVALRS